MKSPNRCSGRKIQKELGRFVEFAIDPIKSRSVGVLAAKTAHLCIIPIGISVGVHLKALQTNHQGKLRPTQITVTIEARIRNDIEASRKRRIPHTLMTEVFEVARFVQFLQIRKLGTFVETQALGRK